MASPGSKCIGAFVLIALIVGACSRAGLSGPPPTETAASATMQPTPTPAPTSAAIATTEPTVAPTPEPTVGLTPEPTDVICPKDSPITVLDLQAGPACFGSATIRVRAWLDRGPILGWMPPVIEPSWLAYPAVHGDRAWALWDAEPANPDLGCFEVDACGFSWLHVQPTSTLDVDGPPRWVMAIGHMDDPAAQRCHWEDSEGRVVVEDVPNAVRICRAKFVLEEIREFEE